MEKLGGSTDRVDSRPGQPVAKVDLYCRDLTGFDLRELATFKNLTLLRLAWSTVAVADLKALPALAGLTALDPPRRPSPKRG